MRLKDPPLLIAVVAIAALVAIAGQLNDKPELVWIFKPLTTLIIVWVTWRRGALADRYAQFVFAGLGLMLLADILAIPEGWLPWALAVIVLAQLCLLRALTADVPYWPRVRPLLASLVVLGALVKLLGPSLTLWPHALLLAAGLALAASTGQAHGRYLLLAAQSHPFTAQSRYAALGTTCLSLAFGITLVNQWHAELPLAALWSLAAYWTGMVLIALSIPVHPEHRSDQQALA